MWPLAILPLYSLHGLFQHYVMEAVAPFYQAFDTFTKHAWVGRATSIVTQVVVLPLMLYFGQSAYHHVLAMYILNDTLHMAIYLRQDVLSWIHHVVCLIGYGVSFFVTPEVLYLMNMGTLILELTSPLIHLCWFANKAGYSGAWWFRYLAGLTILNYFVIRCVWFPYFVFTSIPKHLWFFGGVLTVLNCIWMAQLIGYARAVLRKSGGERLE